MTTQNMPAPTASALKKNLISSKSAQAKMMSSSTPKLPKEVSTVLFEIAWIKAGVQRTSATKVAHCTKRNADHHVIASQSKKASSTRIAITATSITSSSTAHRSAPGPAAPKMSHSSKPKSDNTERKARSE